MIRYAAFVVNNEAAPEFGTASCHYLGNYWMVKGNFAISIPSTTRESS